VKTIIVLEHVFSVEHAVSEFSCALRPGGVAVAQVPNIAYLKHRMSMPVGRLPIMMNTDNQEFIDSWDSQHLHSHTLASLRMVFPLHDFYIEKRRCFGKAVPAEAIVAEPAWGGLDSAGALGGCT
jgi:hypothetical protein